MNCAHQNGSEEMSKSLSHRRTQGIDMDDQEIASFCSITGADDQTARHMLAAADNNLDAAISLYLDSNNAADGHQEAFPEPPVEEDTVRAPIQARRQVLVEDDNDGVGYTSDTFFTTQHRGVTDIGPFDMSYTTSPMDSSRRERLSELFRLPTEIMFQPSTLEAARRQGMQHSSWILLTIHDSKIFACQQMVRDVWNNAELKAFFKEMDLIFLFMHAQSNEAQRYRQYYPFSAFPHWALIDPRTGQRLKAYPSASFASSSTEPNNSSPAVAPVPSASETLQTIAEFIVEHPLQSDDSSDSQEPLVVDLTESDQAEEPKLQEQEEAEEDEKTATSLVNLPEPADSADACLLQIRLSNGSRIKRRFDKETIISDLIQWVLQQEQSVNQSINRIDLKDRTSSLLSMSNQTLNQCNLNQTTLTSVPL